MTMEPIAYDINTQRILVELRFRTVIQDYKPEIRVYADKKKPIVTSDTYMEGWDRK